MSRTLTVLVFAAAGLLMVTSSEHAAGTDLRPERYDDLADLAREQADRVADLRADVAELGREVDRLSAGKAGSELRALLSELDERTQDGQREGVEPHPAEGETEGSTT